MYKWMDLPQSLWKAVKAQKPSRFGLPAENSEGQKQYWQLKHKRRTQV